MTFELNPSHPGIGLNKWGWLVGFMIESGHFITPFFELGAKN